MTCNSTESETRWKTEKVVGNLSVHTLGWIICAVCTIIACAISFYLIYRHATNYTNPKQQRQIVRILLMIPIYSVTTMFSYVWYWHAIYWEVGRDFYEAFAIAAFFALLCQYIGPDLSSQKEYFVDSFVVEPWPWPATWINKCCKGKLRAPRSGLTWFNIVWICVFQYCFVRVATTLLALGTEITGRYCEESLHPKYFHIWSMGLNILAVTVALYFLVAFYVNLKKELAPQKPMLKFMCIKLVIFFSFWQMILFDFLASSNILKATDRISKGDIKIGINALMICFEMIIFSIMHLWAFPWKVYQTSDLGPAVYDLSKRMPPMMALVDAFNPFDLVRAFARGIKWSVVGRKRRHEEAKTVAARRQDSIKLKTNLPYRREEHQGLVAHAEEMGQSSHPGAYPEGFAQGLMVHHPSPVDQQRVPMQDHGFVETEHVGYYPPSSPVVQSGGYVSSSRPTHPELPYPTLNTMPSIHEPQRPGYAPVPMAGNVSPGAHSPGGQSPGGYSPGGHSPIGEPRRMF